MFDPAVVSEGLGQAVTAENRASINGSPDGLGAYAVPQQGDMYAQQRPQQQAPMQYTQEPQQQMAGEWEFIEPDSTSGGAATRSAGLTLLLVALGTGVGYALKGGLGAVAGALLCGGAANAYRAQKWFDSGEPSEKHEAVVSTVFAGVELVAGGYVVYRALQEKDNKGRKRRERDE